MNYGVKLVIILTLKLHCILVKATKYIILHFWNMPVFRSFSIFFRTHFLRS